MKNLFIMLLVFGSAAALADLADDVRCREIGFSKSIEARDMDLFRSFLDNDARFVGGDVRRGPDEITEGWSVYGADEGPTLKWRPQIVEVLKDGKLALSRGPYKYTQKNEDGEDVDYWGTFNSIWRLQDDGSWKVVFDAGSPAAEPTDEQRALIDDDDDVALLGCGG
jgi:ketosteroid isomerase-like protein